jgi:signal transduction histidine kinase
VERHRAASLNLRLTIDLPAALPAARGDVEALRRVIRGLIDNAIKYTRAGGRIVISARETDDMIAIIVSDTGEGISEAHLPHIFEKFYRAGSEASEVIAVAPGVGLGLYLAQHIVGQLDGRLTVESTQGVGTTFTVLLPQWIESETGERSEQNAGVKALVGS